MNPQAQSQVCSQFVMFQRLRHRLLRNTMRVLFGKSLHRFLMILSCCLLIWLFLFGLSFLGFYELERGARQWKISITSDIVLLFLFKTGFSALSVMLIFSSGIILYSSCFKAPEAAFLLTSPVKTDHIFAYKFHGAVAFSSWAFVLLGSPIVLAYGINFHGGSSWLFYVLMPFYFVGFVLIPGSIGALINLLLVNFFPRRKRQFLIVLVGLIVGLIILWFYFRLLPSARRALGSSDTALDFLMEFSIFDSPWMPAYWMGEGMRNAARGNWQSSLNYLCLIWSNGLALYVLVTWLARLTYRRGFNLHASSTGGRRKYGTSLLDKLLAGCLWFLDKRMRRLVDKDFRTFRRDPAQWAQVLILVGLAVMYFAYIRSFYLQSSNPDFEKFRSFITLVNLSAISLLMCAYTGRFIYPMLSLEGKKFWILGLLPLKRSRLILSKFAFSATGTLSTGLFLVIFSNAMMGVDWRYIVLHAGAVAVLALGLSGLAVGMGAMMPNFRETDPSKIAVGFGGTLNLVLGLLFQILILAIMVLPWHLFPLMSSASETQTVVSQYWSAFCFMGLIVGLAIGVAAIFFPLLAGTRAMDKMEF